MSPRQYHPTYYLTDEAAAVREERLVERIAREGLKPGEAVPASIAAKAEAMRAGRLAYVRAAA